MYRRIDDARVREDADRVRVECPACRLPCKPDAARCGCGYDLTREAEEPEARFRGELRRSALSLIILGLLCFTPWAVLALCRLVTGEIERTGPTLPGPVPTLLAIAFVLAGLRRWPSSK